ncbi:IDEAL domain-containing protein [Shouchella patagoniensis]|uniref:IDEAL domain-containing protein n=1 Tax=Shouchella patagoniensis TaxID=228576 RepID=UPI000994B351|nr:IDEAL domain-containing protein [Shouchella patagoniensis]
MKEPFAIDKDVLRQLHVINSLEIRTDLTVQSLYAKAVLTYSSYYFRKRYLEERINEALDNRDKELFKTLATELKAHLDRYKNGRTLYENGYNLYLTF